MHLHPKGLVWDPLPLVRFDVHFNKSSFRMDHGILCANEASIFHCSISDIVSFSLWHSASNQAQQRDVSRSGEMLPCCRLRDDSWVLPMCYPWQQVFRFVSKPICRSLVICLCACEWYLVEVLTFRSQNAFALNGFLRNKESSILGNAWQPRNLA